MMIALSSTRCSLVRGRRVPVTSTCVVEVLLLAGSFDVAIPATSGVGD